MVIHVSFDPADMGLTRSNLNGNPARLRADRYRNVREVAPTHDWQHRIQVVFDALGPTPPALCRPARIDLIRLAHNSCYCLAGVRGIEERVEIDAR